MHNYKCYTTKLPALFSAYLARSAKLPKGYIFYRCFFFIFFLFFLVVAPGATLAQKPMVRSSPKISGLVDNWKGLITPLSFFWFFKGRCHGNQLKSTNRLFSRTNLLCHAAIRKRIAISQFRFQGVHHNEFLYIVYNFGDIRSRNPRVHDVNKSTFCSDTAKICVSFQISQNILDLSWPTLQVC